MGRPIKSGLDYFPLDTFFFEDTKVEFISAKFGFKGEIILIKLLMKIYRENGYFVLFDDDASILFAKKVGDNISISLVKDVVMESVKRGLFDKTIFNKFGVLTSRGIQKRYVKACDDSKRKNINILPEYDLLAINSGKTPEETQLTPEFTQLTHGESTQKKGKEKKGKEIREESTRTHAHDPLLIPDEVHIIWRKAFGRNCNFNEYEFTTKLINLAGIEETERHIRDMSKNGFKKLKTMEEATAQIEEIQTDGTTKTVLKLKPKDYNNGNTGKHNTSLFQQRANWQYDEQRINETLEYLQRTE